MLQQPVLDSVPELTGVPFFPQTDYECGPAALATILGAAGVPVAPADLVHQVYIENLKGSLQAELLGATRRHGLLPVQVPASPASLLAEVASGRPVLVLQNLGLRRAPIWHYAVVVGFDADEDHVVLRSGAESRRQERTLRFLRSWERADHWGFVAVHPGEIPASVAPDRYMHALVGSQRQLGMERAAVAYRAALARWPDDASVLFLAATHEHAATRLAAAEGLYRRVLAGQPDHAAARNNLANALFEQGCRSEALREARAALSREPADSDFHAALEDTLREIEASPRNSAEPASCGVG